MPSEDVDSNQFGGFQSFCMFLSSFITFFAFFDAKKAQLYKVKPERLVN